MKQYLVINVYEAFKERLQRVAQDFDHIVVAFSGGKDSGVLLNLTLELLKEYDYSGIISVLHLDYEAQYTATTEYVDATLAKLNKNIQVFRCCVPFKVQTCTSMFQDHWRPWEEEKKHLWVRPLPKNNYLASDFDFFRRDMWDYEFQDKFASWVHKKTGAKKTCVLIGIRAQESLNRWRTIASERNINKYKKLAWTSVVGDNIINAYPLYDWTTEDIWVANARFGFDYNYLYDLFYQAGVPLHRARVASPFLQAGSCTLALYRAIDPDIWGKMVSRVNGVNFTAIYGGTKAMGWKNIRKPEHFTWKEYMEFLLSTLPVEMAVNYRMKLESSIEFWRNKGGVLSDAAINDLRSAGLKIEVGNKTNYKTEKKPVRMEYADDIDSKDFSLIPTYKRMCICIMKNDHLCKYMGFSLNKHEMARRKAALEKYKDI